MKYKIFLGLCVLLIKLTAVKAQVKSDDIIGIWQTHGDKPAKIRIYKDGEKFYGKIVYLQYPMDNGKPLLDKNNPDKNRQSQPVLGLLLLTGFIFDTDEWDDGHIYDPESGKTYSCTLSLKNDHALKVRGYIGISILGRTEIWTKTEFP